ncbi:MAG: amidohydrolase [Novosphingobium sp.]
MKMKFSRSLGIAMLLGSAAMALPGVAWGSQSAPAVAEVPEGADLLFTNGEIWTPTGWAQAMAVSKGIIVGTGSDAEMTGLAAANATVIDLKGEAVLPGLHDMHVHPMGAGLEQFACRLMPGADAAAIAAQVAACAKLKKPGQWITGGNWIAAGFKPGQQNRQFLDKLAPGNPVMLNDEAHHSLWVNSMVLKLAGITRDTPNPAGGVIERDARGEPTGLLRETARSLVDKIVPEPTDQEKRAALMLAANQMLSYGITSYTDALIDRSSIGTYAYLAGTGQLKQRVRGCIRWLPNHADDPAVSGAALIADRGFYERARLKFDCVKMFLDGVPTESHTAMMLSPYAGVAASDPHAHGIEMVDPAQLFPEVTKFDREGLTVKFHAAGDGAVREAMDAVEAARKANGWGGPSHDIAHDSFVDPADIPRVRALHMTWEFSPYIWFPTPMAEHDITVAIGPERMKRWIPIKDALDTGALVVAGSDWSVVPSVNPWIAIETMVTREVPGGSEETLGEGQRITLAQALRIFTENSAAHMGDRDKVGTIEPGMHADVIVVDRNPFKVPITDVHNTKVLMTFIDGEEVYDAASPPRLTAN